LRRQLPKLQAFQEIAILFSENASNRSQSPIFVRFVELGSWDSILIERGAKLFQLLLVSNGEMDVRRMMVSRATKSVCVFDGGMASLNSLLREWDVSARDGVQVGFGNLQHFCFLR
jgi:hypothetical protein